MSDKKEVKILNYWWASNYGANLTAFALNEIIKQLDYNPINVDNSDWKQQLSDSIYTFAKDFFCKYLNPSKRYINLSDFLLSSFSKEIYIVGSDQVFRPNLNNRISETFLLDYVNINAKKIAFSASFGKDKECFYKETSLEQIEKMKNALTTFDFISVREKSGIEICKDIFNIEAELIVDPVFILNKSIYNKLTDEATNNFSKKIISYFINEENKIKKYKNTNVIPLARTNVSVENWLCAIKNCELLITDSFHGVCFSIIFNKPFICIVNSSSGSTRYDSLFEILGIKNQCINNINEIYERDCIFKIDYDLVNKRIEEERRRGLDFLKKALETPVQVTQEKMDARMKFLENKVFELEQQSTLKNQLKKELWTLWLIIFHKYLPVPIKNIIRFMRRRIK